MAVNMSYCRFENTLAALRECQQSLYDTANLDHLSERERAAADAINEAREMGLGEIG